MRLLLLLVIACVAPAPPEQERPPDSDHDGVEDAEDCQPLDPDRSPRVHEKCNGIDDDCDYEVDEGLRLHLYYDDSDGDGWGDPDVLVEACGGEGVATGAGDCDPGNADVHPGAIDVCDAVDSDCDGDFEDGPPRGDLVWFLDRDGDGYGDPTSIPTRACLQPRGHTLDDMDCDDRRADVNPGAAEICDEADTDEDCDGRADEADPWQADGMPMYVDADHDGAGDATAAPRWRCAVTVGWSLWHDDCLDTDPDTHPAALERCDEVDNDCDGTIDERAVDARLYYVDRDADGYGDGARARLGCDLPRPWVPDGGDCDDGRDDIYPRAPEADCTDPTDYNCDGSAGIADSDGDGIIACYDCDDADAGTSPARDERCDEVDNNCDGSIDPTDSVDATNWFEDLDGDGYGNFGVSEWSCTQPPMHVLPGEDCDDADPAVNPAQPDTCGDGVDWNCDGDEC